ncbi:cyclin-D3-1-like [Neltuma alba]|uniref:cyclin-D3-1-like n=2 Tax=Neltuma alba TaxID=207710 RepID=UPI0010A47A9A|nr:cyclin-D3-1-like [Prosopis alba]
MTTSLLHITTHLPLLPLTKKKKKEKKMAFQDSSFLLDSLYCHEPNLDEQDDEQEHPQSELSDETDLSNNNASLFPLLLLEQDLFWEDQDLISLFTKEQQQHQEVANFNLGNLEFSGSRLSLARREAVEWILKVNTHHGFSALTSTLAINYLDRFILSFKIEIEKPWMIQLVAVTCLSLAAKVEETQLPPLLDLQVEGTKYVFEGKTILRMELLVLSTLKWKMHPVTPLSFLDHIIRRLGLKTHLHWQFLKRCEHLLLSALSDSRFVGCLPSVLATATMLRVIEQIQHNDAAEYKKQLLDVLKINKEKVEECYKAILEASDNKNRKKRKHDERIIIPVNLSGLIDGGVGTDEGSNGSWKVGSSSSLCSSPDQSLLKRNRAQQQHQQQQRNMKLSPLNLVGVAIVVSSPK